MISKLDNLRSQGRCKIRFLAAIMMPVLASVLAVSAQAEGLTLLMPDDMVKAGFHKQILPRFKFKHRIGVEAVTEGAADMVFGEAGVRVFQKIDGAVVHLKVTAADATAQEQAAKFLEWLKSTPGKAAIESFEVDGAAVYTTVVAAVEIEVEDTFDGDTALGARLALVHCGRCHVVDERNRMGGIGSAPSFGALRGREDWSSMFLSFFYENPHPSFTQVEGVTGPFDPDRQIHVAPVLITVEEIEAITAFVATLKPKLLGRPIQSN